MKHLALALIVLALIGTINAGYLLWQHFAPAGSAFCNISATLSCDVVNKSTFAEILGFPVSGVGILGNVFFVVIGLLMLKKEPDSRLPFVLLFTAIGAMLFSLYLTAIEAFWLGVYCPLCLLSQVLVTIILGLSIQAAWLQWKKTHPPAPQSAPM